MMKTKWPQIVWVVLLAACSGAAPQSSAPAQEPADPSVKATESLQTATVAPTPGTQNLSDGDNQEWHLVASFQWVGSATPTDMLYTWEAWFTVAPDGTLLALDQVGWAEGQAGIVWGDNCVEAQPTSLDWNYTFSGRVTQMDQTTVEQRYGEVSDAITDQGMVEMFVFDFSKPDVFEYNLPSFSCAPDFDREMLKSTATYWITTIPVMIPEFRTVPAEVGMFCTEVLSFEEEDLGTLIPCYLLEKQ